MMQQYRAAKEAHPDMLLLFRMGDFYETFGTDAELLSRVLDLRLTSRDSTMPMAGFPYHQLERYLQKLLQAGYRVAICDQVEDASQAKGLVRREVTRVVTPGTVTEDELLDPRQANHLAALCGEGGQVGLAWLDLSSGGFWAVDLPRDQLVDEITRLRPAEVLVPEKRLDAWQNLLAANCKAPLMARPDWTFDDTTARDALKSQLRVHTLAGFGFDDTQLGLIAAGAILLYLKETLKTGCPHVQRIQPYRPEHVLQLDEVTRRSLELTRTLRDNSRDGSLLSVLDRTVTAMGARLLHDWLVTPLTDRAKIEARHEAIGELLADASGRLEVRAHLVEAADLQRLTARVSTGRASPRDLAAIGRTLALLPRLKAKLAGRRASRLQALEAQIELCPDLRQIIESALHDEPPLNPRDGGVIRDGFHAELDELRQLAREGKGWIARFQAQEITRTGIPSLKVGFNQVFGYYIEVTHVHSARVPPEYRRVQTLKNAERYTTPELKEYEDKVRRAEERSRQLELELFQSLRDQIAAHTPRLLRIAEILAELDVLTALAELASSRQYTRPKMVDEPVLHIEAGRHPVLDQTLPPGTFVPNDVHLDAESGRLWLITGPNMSGKSTFIRQVALLTLLAHAGSFVPARAATIGIVDRIFTRVGASDELSRGQSTFMVEMTEAANILNNATSRSLVILDEIGRGTSTYDGVSLAWAITEHLHDAIGCRALFATHYHELAQLADSLTHLRNYHVLVEEAQQSIVFLHRIAPGSAERSYGIHVAQLAGVPASVLQRAQVILAELESRHQLPAATTDRRKPRKRSGGPSLFGEDVDL
jgi:DNA mismatch repair protein MutS